MNSAQAPNELDNYEDTLPNMISDKIDQSEMKAGAIKDSLQFGNMIGTITVCPFFKKKLWLNYSYADKIDICLHVQLILIQRVCCSLI